LGVIFWGILASVLLGLTAGAQEHPQAGPGTSVLQGHLHDSGGKPVAGASVSLRRTGDAAKASAGDESQIARTDSAGAFHFSGLVAGTYGLRAELKGTDAARTGVAVVDALRLSENGSKTIEMVLQPVGPQSEHASSNAPSSSSGSSNSDSPKRSGAAHASDQQPAFFDEPQFTVAGVAPATNSGGHGSDTVLRNSEALVKATVSLGDGSEGQESPNRKSLGDTEATRLKAARAALQGQILADKRIGNGKDVGDAARQKESDIHRQLAQIDERLDDPLAAAREYQRAAEIYASEASLFDWGSELLVHRALEAATDVFEEGNRRYPKSVRMLIGLGVTWYARGSYDRAAQYLGGASDLDPADPTPYLFMGRMQSVETVPSPETVQRLARFQNREPWNALANYYYAVSVWKSQQAAGALNEASSAQVESLLRKAIVIDPKLGLAHLQMGILFTQRRDYSQAIAAYQRAIEVSPELEEAHYRLAQAYRRTGDEEKAREQLKMHEELSKRAKERAESERGKIQQFVVSLRDH
jgi:tetratricopeptide (TPR) repeat protein